MIKPWEISVLVYDYLKKSGYKETSVCFNNECSSLKLSEPVPNIFSCVLEKLLSNGDLESRLKSYDEAQERGQSEAEKLKRLEKEMLHIRKRLKKRKRDSSEHDSKIKHRKTISTQEKNNPQFSVSSPYIPPLNTSLYTTDTHLTTSGFENSLMQQTHHNSSAKFNPLMFPELSSVNSAEKSLSDEKSVSDNVLRTPEKRLSTSRRKAATPKKFTSDRKSITSDIQGTFVQTLTDNINAKNEEAALDTLNSVEPWLEHFISSLSQNPDESELTNEDLPQPQLCIDYNNTDSKNEEAALSLLALNQSAELVPTVPPPVINPSALVIASTASSNILPHQLNSLLVTSADSPCNPAVSATISELSFPQQSVALARIENRTVMTTSQASVPTAAESTTRDHITGVVQQAASPLISNNTNHTECASSSQANTTDGNLSFDPILIRNQKTFSMAQRNPNMEIIVLPPIHTQYQHILPKPSQAPDPVPSSFHVSGDTVAPIYNFVKPSPQQEAQKFFGQLHRPYHQQLSQIDQLYLVDRSEKIAKVNAPQTSTETGTDLESKKIKDAVKVPDKPESQPDTTVDTSEIESVAGSNSVTIPKTTFVSWDQKIRKSIAETDFKTPPPPSGVKKKKRRSKEKSVQMSEVHSPSAGSDFLLDVAVPGGPIPVEVPTDKKRKKKRRKSKKDASEKLSSKSKKLCSKIKKKKKKREKEKESLKKPPITPEFVNESLSSEGEVSVTCTPRFRHMSESDSVMAESLLKSFNNSSNLPKSPQDSSTPVTSKVVSAALSVRQNIADTIMPSFIEENANSSFDIDEASRPKPVFIPEGSQNSCSCHSNHYKDNQKGKCPSTKTFSFKDQENIDSPKNYDENSNSITVSSLFPTISSSSVNMSPKTEITNRTLYRNQKEDEESENEQEEAASDDEVREKTSKLPPISSQDKDLLDSSDEEQHISATSDELGLFSAKDLSKSVALSESDVDSPLKKSPVKSPKLKLIPLMKKERYVPPLKPNDSRKKGVKPKNILVAAEHGVQDIGEELATELEEAEHLPSFLEIEDDINDSQELVIDGDEVAPKAGCHPDIRLTSRLESRTRLSISKGKDRHPKLLDKSVRKSGDLNRSAVENIRNKENTGSPSVIEDSCDTWYQNVENKMKLKSGFTCEICRKTFPSLAVLTVHSETCSKMYLICSNCGRKCSSKSGLTLHRKTCLNMLNSSKAKEKRKSSGENSKIKISPSNSKSGSQKKSLKKKKSKGYIDKDIDEFLGNLRYQ